MYRETATLASMDTSAFTPSNMSSLDPTDLPPSLEQELDSLVTMAFDGWYTQMIWGK